MKRLRFTKDAAGNIYLGGQPIEDAYAQRREYVDATERDEELIELHRTIARLRKGMQDMSDAMQRSQRAKLSEDMNLAQRAIRSVFRWRERYVKAWLAVTGIDPRNCEMVVEIDTTNPQKAVSVVRMREITKPQPLHAPMEMHIPEALRKPQEEQP